MVKADCTTSGECLKRFSEGGKTDITIFSRRGDRDQIDYSDWALFRGVPETWSETIHKKQAAFYDFACGRNEEKSFYICSDDYGDDDFGKKRVVGLYDGQEWKHDSPGRAEETKKIYTLGR